MKNPLYLTILCLVVILISSCNSLDLTEKNRDLTLSGKTVNEKAYGGCERWYAVDKDSSDFLEDILFQVGYFKANNMGFVLHGDSTYGEETSFKREGLNLRWDWDETASGYRA